MTTARSILLMLTLALALVSCQSKQSGQTVPGETDSTFSGTAEDMDGGVLTPTEEDIVQAFAYEVDEQWLEAAVLYDKLARSSIQPERSAYLVKVALMYYYGGLYDEIDPFFDALDEQDILLQDQQNKETVKAGGYLGNGKIYRACWRYRRSRKSLIIATRRWRSISAHVACWLSASHWKVRN